MTLTTITNETLELTGDAGFSLAALTDQPGDMIADIDVHDEAHPENEGRHRVWVSSSNLLGIMAERALRDDTVPFNF